MQLLVDSLVASSTKGPCLLDGRRSPDKGAGLSIGKLEDAALSWASALVLQFRALINR